MPAKRKSKGGDSGSEAKALKLENHPHVAKMLDWFFDCTCLMLFLDNPDRVSF